MPSKLCIPCSSIPWDKLLASVGEDETRISFVPYRFSYHPSPTTTGVGDHGCSVCKVLFSTHPELELGNLTVRISNIYSSDAPDDIQSSLARYLVLRFERALTELHTLTVVEFNVCARQDQSEDNLFLGRLVEDPITLGLQSVTRSWFDSCTHTHKECMKFQEVNALLPTRILDIGMQDQDLISLREFPSGSNGQYAALSHCWGTKQTFITSSTNLEDRKKFIDFNELPQTFRDAISVTKSLGINYLWIDSLCIIQNDIDDWKRESVKMEQVYSDATLVISASRATSDSTGFLNPRRTDEIISISYGEGEKTSNLYVQQALQPFSSLDPLKSEPLHQRGWALQERYLPRRTLYFGSHQIFWNCQTLSRSEDGRILQRPWFDLQELLLPAKKTPGKDWASSEQLMLYQPWYDMIDTYMSCGLTYESDRLPAIAGLAKAFWLKSQDSYLAGLWRGGLLAGLLWRRYEFAALHRPAAFRAPSWSWASVDGEIEFRVYAWYNKSPHGIEYFASLQDVQIDVDNGPFGTVSGGWLSIDAPIFPIVGSRGPFGLSNYPDLLYKGLGKVTISGLGAYHGVFNSLLRVKVPENDVLIAGSFDFPEDHENITTGSLFALFIAGASHPPHFRHASSNEGFFGLIVKKNEDGEFSRVGILHGKFMAEDRSHSDEETFTQYRSWRKEDYLSSTSKIESQASWCDISLHEKERKVSILR